MLTDQERTVLDLIGEGLTNRQIAERMFLAEKTVKNYVSHLLAKLGMQRRTQAAVFASQFRKSGRPTPRQASRAAPARSTRVPPLLRADTDSVPPNWAARWLEVAQAAARHVARHADPVVHHGDHQLRRPPRR